MSNSSINTTNPIAISSGGTGSSSFSNVNGTVYYDGTVLRSISPGTTGQVLISNGSGSAPSFQTVAGSGEWVLLQTITANNTFSDFTFTSGISATYITYVLVVNRLVFSGDNTMNLLFSTNGGSTYISTYVDTYVFWNNNGGSSNSQQNTNLIRMSLARPGAISGTVYLYNLCINSANIYPTAVGNLVTSSPNLTMGNIYGVTASDSLLINALQVQCGSTVNSGSISLYGIVN